MKRFLTRLTLFVAIQVVIAAVVFYHGMPRGSGHYMCALQDKVDRLKQCEDGRLLMIGGSNVAFGIHSQPLQEATGMETVNLGMHMMLGLDFQLECARQHGKTGDVVVLMPEYHLLASEHQDGDPNTILQLTEQWPTATRYFEPSRYASWKAFFDRDALGRSHEWLKRGWNKIRGRAENGIYRRSSFNAYGDVVAHHGQTCHSTMLQNEPLPNVDSARLDLAIKRLNDFAAECAQKDIAVYFSYPPIPVERFASSSHVIEQIHTQLQHRLTIPMLNEPEDFVYPIDHFFDTTYHLTDVGGAKRTESVVASLLTQPRVARDLGGIRR